MSDPFADSPHPAATADRAAETRPEVLDALDGLDRANPLVLARPEPSEYGALFASVPREPRDRGAMLAAARWVGSRLGKRAIYSWEAKGKRGPSLIEGPTIGLAYALAGEWGDTATRALLVERVAGRAKFRGVFADLQRRTLVEREYVFSLAPAPGGFAGDPAQRQRWETMQEQSAASKAVRGAILAGLPAWLVDEALDAAREAVSGEALTVHGEDGQPVRLDLATALERAVRAFGAMRPDPLTEADLVALVGRPRELWALSDLVRLRDVRQQLREGTMTAAAVLASVRAAETPSTTTTQADRIAAAVARQTPPPTPPPREPTVALAPPAAPKADGEAPETARLREELRGLLRQRPDACAARGVNNAHGIARGGEVWLRATLAAVQEEIAREDEVARGRQGWTLADGGGREGVAREDAAAVRPGLAAADDDPAEGPQNSLFGED